MSILHLACASSAEYTPHCAAMIHSVLQQRGKYDVSIHYLHGPDFLPGSEGLLRGMVERMGGAISFVSIPDERIVGLPINLHFSRAMWYRVYLPAMLPDVDRVLYLDADLIAVDSLEPLWETNLGDNYVAAVTNVFGPWDMHYPGKLGLSGPEVYFNTGVILMNLDQLRRIDSSTALREFALERGKALWFCDQDAMNVVLGRKRLHLHPRWNCTNSVLEFDASFDVLDRTEVEEARARPAIRHFEGGGANKPWHLLCDHRMKEVYFEHRRQTPWPKVKLEGVTAANVVRWATAKAARRLRGAR